MEVRRNNICFQVKNNSNFWDAFNSGTWEKETIQILDKTINNDHIFIDIGAWIGPISLYVSSKVNKCYSFEPDPEAYRQLSENLKLNQKRIQNVKTFNQAITFDGKELKLYSKYSHGDSGSSILKRVKSTNKYYEVESITFSEFIKEEKIEKIDFIKMDIEGGEFSIIPSMIDAFQYYKPTLLISFHYQSLVDFYMLKFLPIGGLRRIYRLLSLNFIQNKARNKMMRIIESVGSRQILDHKNKTLSISQLKQMDLSVIDMLLFKW